MRHVSYNKLRILTDNFCNNVRFSNNCKSNKEILSLCDIYPFSKQ